MLSLLTTVSAHASCPVALKPKTQLDEQEIAEHRAAITEMHTPFEDASANVQDILRITRKSWLEQGRPDKVATKDFQKFADAHLYELKASIAKMKEQQSKQPYILKQISQALVYAQNVLKEFNTLNADPIIEQNKWLKWATKAAWVYHLQNTIMQNPTVEKMRETLSDELLVTSQVEKLDPRVSALPVFSGFNWRELNDLWFLGITPYTLTKSSYDADGLSMDSFMVTAHDLGHVYYYSVLLPEDILARLDIFKKNFEIYKKFRSLQSQETSERRKHIREGMMFYILHELGTTEVIPKMALFKSDTIAQTLFDRFSREKDFGNGFDPKVNLAEIIKEVDWFAKHLANF